MFEKKRFAILDENNTEIQCGTVKRDHGGIISLEVDGRPGGGAGYKSFEDAIERYERKLRQGENMAGWSVRFMD